MMQAFTTAVQFLRVKVRLLFCQTWIDFHKVLPPTSVCLAAQVEKDDGLY